MLAYLLVVAGQVLTLFLLMGVGFVLFRRGSLDGTGLAQMTHLLLYVVTPCVIINSLQTDWDSALLHNLALGAGLLALSYAAYGLLVQLLFRRRTAEERGVLRFGAMYGNCGFMGLPLVAEVLGESALIYAALCVVCFNVFSWVHGAVLIGGRQAASLKRALFNPGVLPLLCGLPLLLLPFHLDSTMYTTLVILAAVPTAGLTAMFAQRFDRCPGAAAQLVTLSTLLCVLTLPLFAALARALAG